MPLELKVLSYSLIGTEAFLRHPSSVCVFCTLNIWKGGLVTTAQSQSQPSVLLRSTGYF